jgi:hypothetical protein
MKQYKENQVDTAARKDYNINMTKHKTKSNIKCDVCLKPFKKGEDIFLDDDSDGGQGFLHWDCSFVVDMLQTKAGGKLYDNACKYLDKKYKLTSWQEKRGFKYD